MDLSGKNILIGISGGIAAYKIYELIRKLTKEGANVRVVLTPNALEFVTPTVLATLSGNEPYWQWDYKKPLIHIEYDFETGKRHSRQPTNGDLVRLRQAKARSTGSQYDDVHRPDYSGELKETPRGGRRNNPHRKWTVGLRGPR